MRDRGQTSPHTPVPLKPGHIVFKCLVPWPGSHELVPQFCHRREIPRHPVRLQATQWL